MRRASICQQLISGYTSVAAEHVSFLFFMELIDNFSPSEIFFSVSVTIFLTLLKKIYIIYNYYGFILGEGINLFLLHPGSQPAADLRGSPDMSVSFCIFDNRPLCCARALSKVLPSLMNMPSTNAANLPRIPPKTSRSA